jgi:DNA-binding NarL/FixJ family response regulator
VLRWVRDSHPEPHIVTAPPTVLVADADSASRSSVVSSLRRVGYETREAASGIAVLEATRGRRPGLVVIDISLPDVTGYEVCRELREKFGEGLPIIFISADRTEPLDRVGGLLIGADDYLVKPCDLDDLGARVRRLLPRHPRSAQAGGVARLTDRETEVLRLLAEGLSTPKIADELVISVKTVGAHIQRIFSKLGVHSQAQAVARAYHERIVEAKSIDPPEGSARNALRFAA